MRYALIDGKLIEAAPSLNGIYPGCNNPVIAKCGVQRIHHWSHKNTKACDSWWEPETEWHRSWKNHFSVEWQEHFLPDLQTGEKHIADVHTSHGLVVEFQHSSIHPHERVSRERFYKNMIWVVDGRRLKRDHPRFLKGRNDFRATKQKGVFTVNFPEECFPLAWLESSVPVIFDYLGYEQIGDLTDQKNDVYCLFPTRIVNDAMVAVISRKGFIDAISNGSWSAWTNNLMIAMQQVRKEMQRRQDNIAFQKFLRSVNYPKRRRRF